ncbi:unnamed protein product, partial [Darwinula stevensoni]
KIFTSYIAGELRCMKSSTHKEEWTGTKLPDPGASQYGNFINYYHFNPPENRLHSFKSSNSEGVLKWVMEKSTKQDFLVLDIGCNSGELTEGFAQILLNGTRTLESPKRISVLGVDLDQSLIQSATDSRSFADSCDLSVRYLKLDIMDSDAINTLQTFLRGFDHTCFDLTLCFSVTMWVHLNHGDEGLSQFLSNVAEVSEHVLIEPQPWKCYRNAQRRMIRNGLGGFFLYHSLKVRSNVDEWILSKLTSSPISMNKLFRFESSSWGRSMTMFSKKHSKIELPWLI